MSPQAGLAGLFDWSLFRNERLYVLNIGERSKDLLALSKARDDSLTLSRPDREAGGSLYHHDLLTGAKLYTGPLRCIAIGEHQKEPGESIDGRGDVAHEVTRW